MPKLDPVPLVQLGRALQAAGYRFTTVTPATQARVLARDPGAWAANLRDVFGWSKPYTTGGTSRDSAENPAALPPGMAELMERSGIVQQLGQGERSTLRCSTLDGQLYFHSAYPTSDAGAVFFGPDTCRFIRALRAEAGARERSTAPAPQRIADLCCGAGPAAIALAGMYPEAEVLAIDINQQALTLARVNAELAGVANLRAIYSDLLAGVGGGLDLIVANPPYLLDQAQRSYRHGGGELGEGLAVRIIAAALERLNPGGMLMLYTGVAMAEGDAVEGGNVLLRHAAPLLDAADCTWHYQEIDPDVFGEELAQPAYAQAERIAAIWLTAIKL